MKNLARVCIVLGPALFAAAALAGDPPAPSTIRYTFDEPNGQAVHDSGSAKAEGTLSGPAPAIVEDAGFTIAEPGQWQPILRNGAQVKNIKPGSDHLLLDTEAPVVFDRKTDYEIDYVRGLIKPLASGRMRPGDRVVVGLTYSYAGPTRVPGRNGLALSFNGADAFVDCGEPDGLAAVSALDIDLWIKPEKNWNPDAVLVSKGAGFSLAFDKGKLVFTHAGLGAGATSSPAPVELKPDAWHHLTASYFKGSVVVQIDDHEAARSDKVTGALAAEGPLHLGGTVDPHFFSGLMDDVAITFTPAKNP